ncbi:MAG: UDP-N-acetylmuramoyl-L-alanine--D-glutamate ligase [Clostridium sp.]|nr:UDP-N-acetylmuramoyl-L-alanine--D-glutamate ligase [Clostridium sp.]MCM1444381.1 UDP-N-acetylmuramoyl-L-alanine--D-glutamate ligase [Candidatus Amulumruptor caecigallinarius]
MYNKILEFLKNKKIAVVGFGKEGKSTYKFIRKYSNQHLTILDSNENLLSQNEELESDKNIDIITGKNYLDSLEDFDLIIKSPGIKFKDIDISKFEERIVSQLSLTLDYFKNNTIGITGTKGKSTTTSLISEVLKRQGYDAYLLGNIGIPIFDYIDKINDKSIFVIEMAGPQLEFVHSSPHIGIILNLFEEHLDFFKSKNDYFLSKMNMFKYQTNEDYGLYSSLNDTLKDYVKKGSYDTNLIDIDSELIIRDNYIEFNNKKLYDITSKRNLLGNHNLENIKFVLRLSELLNLNLDKTIETINEFECLEHRMEYVGTFNGVKYYNDSIATIPDATINCLEALVCVDTIIFGGMDRGIDYSKLIKYFNESNINNFICMPETGYKIGKQIKKGNVYMVETLEEAVLKAKEVTKKICVMSPAAPSYNAFKNFEEKGRMYKVLIKK